MRRTPLFAVLFAMLFAAPAGAAVPHVVQPGETLWSIAAANNLTTRTVAAFNGLSESSQVVLGSTVMVPSTVEGYASLQKAGLVSAPARRAAAAARLTAAPAPAGGRRSRPAGRLHRPRGRHALRPRRRRPRVGQRDRLDERAQPERRAARRNGHQAADRRPGARPRRAARSRRDGRARRRSRRRPRPVSAPPTSSPSPPLTASPPRWRPRSPTRRAASTTRWSRARTPAASCRSCRARGTTCSRTWPSASSTRTRPPTT